MVRYRAIVEYDGSNFSGWQKHEQSKNQSIQGAIECAISACANEQVIVYGASRTDAGVHALGQVLHFDLKKLWDVYKLRCAINYHICKGISIIDLVECVSVFHSRFSKSKKSYMYRIVNRSSKLAIDRGRAWHVGIKLDYNLMNTVARDFLGVNDFTSFRNVKCQSRSTIKEIDTCDVQRIGNEIRIFIVGSSFLYNQVRIMVGTLVQIGMGKNYDLKFIFKARDRRRAGVTAPAYGLYLVSIDYL